MKKSLARVVLGLALIGFTVVIAPRVRASDGDMPAGLRCKLNSKASDAVTIPGAVSGQTIMADFKSGLTRY